jgi:hypothetical protein
MNLRFRGGILIEPPLEVAASNCGVKFTKGAGRLRSVSPTLTCYFRHLAQVFKKADIEVTPQNRQEIDMVIHDIVGVKYKNCPAAWKQVKTHILQDEANFVSTLKAAWENRK